MVKIREVQQSFVSGELSDDLFGRDDTEIFRKGAAELRNVYVDSRGGVYRREGLEDIDGITSNQEGRLIPFEFNDEQTYILVFTPGEFKVYRTDSDTLQATVTSSPISGITKRMISEMRFTQSADTLYLFHLNLQPIKITRTSDTAWTASSVTFSNIPPFSYAGISTNTPAGDVTPDVTSGRVVLTGTGTNFTSAYLRQYINMPKGGRILVTAINSTTEIEGRVVFELASTSTVVSGDWELESGYVDVINGTQGWPRSGTFFKGRLWLGGLKSRPQTIIASKIGDFEDLDEGSALDDEAINFTIDDNKVNIIRDLFPGRGLQIFTSGGEFTIRSEVNDAVTPSNIADQLRKDTLHGSGPAPASPIGTRWASPVSVDGASVFVESSGGVVRQFVYNDVERSFNANNISLLSQHIISRPVAMDIRRAIQGKSSDFLYVVNDLGKCCVLNSLREQDLLAWSLFETDGDFEDVAVSGREVFFIVKRTINGATVRRLEKLNDLHFLDSSVRIDNGTPTTTWSGFDHLNGQEIKVRADDFIFENATPSSGSITTESATVLEGGFNFISKITSMPISIIIQGQKFSGKFKSMIFVNMLLKSSRNIVVDFDGVRQKPAFRSFGDQLLDDPTPLFTGWKKVFCGGYNRNLQVTITQEEPLEFNVLSAVYGVKV